MSPTSNLGWTVDWHCPVTHIFNLHRHPTDLKGVAHIIVGQDF